MYIEVTSLENFSAPTQTEPAGTPQARTHHTVFNSFFFNERKNDSSQTIAHRKRTN